ncbi:anaerobic ribonucleoside-triphosphate reductase activating protein [Caldicellulosiruptoraceae bacterium PP1]
MLVDFMKVSTVDYPGKVAATAFFGGCNFSCYFCHNSKLIRAYNEKMNEEEFFNYLDKRKGIVDAVCITGGEPTLNEEYLIWFIRQLKKRSLLVKLDTNGSNPNIIKEIINNNLIDYIAMDIKTSLKKYKDLTGYDNIDNIKESIEIIKNSFINHEFRTTVSERFHELNDFIEIINLIDNSKYYLQPYSYSPNVLDVEISGQQNQDLSFLYKIKEKLNNLGHHNIIIRS